MSPTPYLYLWHLRNTKILLGGPTLVIVNTSVMGRHSADTLLCPVGFHSKQV